MTFLNIFNGSQKPPPTSSTVSSQKKVLIVEDDNMLSFALKVKFQHEGFAAVTAENGQVGLDQVISEKPDCIILDLMMPVMDGKTMLRKLREMPEYKNLPVIVLTNAGSTDNMTETQSYFNANAFLVKSNTSTEEIVNQVNKYLST